MNHAVFSSSNIFRTIELGDIKSNKTTSHIYDHHIEKGCGKGIIRFIKLDLGFRVVELDCLFTKNVQLNLYNTNKKYLYFLYCTEGHIYHKFNNLNKFSSIEELSLAITGSDIHGESYLLLKQNKPIRLSMVCLDQSIFFKEYISNIPLQSQASSKTDELLDAITKLNDYVYSCSKNLKFAESLRTIMPFNVDDELLNLLEVRSNYLKLLSSYLGEFYNELFVERSSTKLTTKELQKIRRITEQIIDHTEYPYSIKMLCSKSGLSPAKLQEGFKTMHNTTVSDFIRNKRLDKAEELFATTDYNVSEVVYMVGITSRSYFCKIFKSKFGHSPSSYRKLKSSNKKYKILK